MTFEQFITEVSRQRRLNRYWRYGQTIFNVLHAIRPDLSEQMRGAYELDPFYRDDLTHRALNWIKENW